MPAGWVAEACRETVDAGKCCTATCSGANGLVAAHGECGCDGDAHARLSTEQGREPRASQAPGRSTEGELACRDRHDAGSHSRDQHLACAVQQPAHVRRETQERDVSSVGSPDLEHPSRAHGDVVSSNHGEAHDRRDNPCAHPEHVGANSAREDHKIGGKDAAESQAKIRGDSFADIIRSRLGNRV
jgi:hypothetical protein